MVVQIKKHLVMLGVVGALVASLLPKVSLACPGSRDKGCVADASTMLDLGITTQQQLVQQTGVPGQTATPVAMVAPVTSRYETPGTAVTTKTVASDTQRYSGFHATQFGTLGALSQRALEKSRNIEECVDYIQATTAKTATQINSQQEIYVTPQATVDRTSADIVGVESCVLKFPISTQPDDRYYTANSDAATSTVTKSGDGVLLVGSFGWTGGISTNAAGYTLQSFGGYYGPVTAPTGRSVKRPAIAIP